MVVVLVLAGVAVLGAVVVLAMGRGGELAEAHPDYPPVSVDSEGRPVAGWDGSHLRFPRTLWGYQPHVTDDAFHLLTEALYERDARVAELERQLHDARKRAGDAEPAGPVGTLHGIEEPGARVPLRKESFEPDGEESR
ncbi:hypothetical protein SAMN06265355_110322 [Actinomadura mexicana]|uniref:DivIVA domain-containing protein n=1 Tax=Actinomadura mexicana TaxID=134959 RepID=A0A239BP78_9ACTN|nr:hypothetical protein SAMN06265355_110322 [Actinomadura mexicana]